ncbi:MAG: riboflavin synthase [Thermoanaerobaculia bacterium]
MFSGLVRERGRLVGAPKPSGQGGKRLAIAHSRALGARLGPGASLAVAGVCLTVLGNDPELSEVELSPETLARTTLGELRDGAEVNLEPALLASEALGGHWVQGHVDGVLEVVERRDSGAHRELGFTLPEAFRAWVVEKGSVTLDGVSLTVSRRLAESFEVALIPHTLEVTTLRDLVPGQRVNFEADVLAKYVLAALELYGRPAGAP